MPMAVSLKAQEYYKRDNPLMDNVPFHGPERAFLNLKSMQHLSTHAPVVGRVLRDEVLHHLTAR